MDKIFADDDLKFLLITFLLLKKSIMRLIVNLGKLRNYMFRDFEKIAFSH